MSNGWLRSMIGASEHPSLHIRDSDELLPQYVVSQIYEATKGEAIIVTGVGQHQMWAAQYYYLRQAQQLHLLRRAGDDGLRAAGGHGGQGGAPDETVWCIAGDGSIQMTIQELATHCPGETGGQDRHHEQRLPGHGAAVAGAVLSRRRYVATPLSCPDFVKLAEAYCIPA